MLAVGHAAYARKDWPAAMKAFQQSAEAGSAEGAWELSLMHAHGKCGVVDKDQAREWLKIAADGGAVKAQMFLAQMSTFGRGGYDKDESVAFNYLERAADQGNAHATHQLGVRYLYAVGVEQDLDKAIAHFDKAIELGSTDAVKDREIAQKKKSVGVVRGIKKGLSKRVLGRSKSKKNTVESSLRIKAASAPLKSPSSSRQTSRQSTPAQSPVASPTSQPAFEEEAVPSPTAGAKRPAPAAASAAAKRPAIREPSPRAAAEAAETPPRARFVERADTWEAPPAAAAPEQALRKFAFAYGAIVLLGVGLAVASEYL